MVKKLKLCEYTKTIRLFKYLLLIKSTSIITLLGGCRAEVFIAQTFRYEHIRNKQNKAKDVRQVVPIKREWLIFFYLTQVNLWSRQ